MTNRILPHIAFWLAYALYDGYLSTPWSGTTFEGLGFWERISLGYRAELVLLLFKVPMVYFVLYRLLPQGLRRRNWWVLGGQILAVATVVTVLNRETWMRVIYPYVFGIIEERKVGSLQVEISRWLYSSFDVLMLLAVTAALKLFRLRLQSAERERQLSEEKLQSELRFLRSQTNPHFLFNTLNNLYHLARKQSKATPDAILKLSDLLRFMLYECSTPRIPMAQEIKVIRDYLELERLRYGERLALHLIIEVDDEEQPIAPLLLLPFVENAFKHGASESRGDTWLNIALRVKNGLLDFEVQNPKDPAQTPHAEGIGLKNVKRQLELLYPGHELTLDNQGDKFLAQLKINL